MDRRRFLTATVVGAGSISGCVVGGARFTGNRRHVSLSNVDDVSDEYGLQIDLELLRGIITDQHTAHLRMTATDETSRKRTIGIGTGNCNPFNRSAGRSKPHGLWLLTPNNSNRNFWGKWTTEQGEFLAYGCGFSPSVHDQPIINEYEVWDDGAVDGYMKPDTYRFTTSITVGKASSETTTTTETPQSTSLDWGFDLTVENPDS